MGIPAGLYIHFPFCLSRCSYCDFVTSAVDRIPHETYAQALTSELELRLRDGSWHERELVSIYVGGGTPSLWRPAAMAKVLDRIARSMTVSSSVEVTMEANPGQGQTGRLKEYVALGVNRISFGIQSFQERYLRVLGRCHGEKESLSAVDGALLAGFERVSIDLIYAIPGQDVEGAREDARRAGQSGADHISAYCLTLHEGVPMDREVRAGRLRLVDDDVAADMEAAVLTDLALAGFVRYEVSNVAREDRRSVHNSGYWTGREYLGLGAGAHGFKLLGGDGRRGGVRYRNLVATEKYISALAGGVDPTEEEERLSPKELVSERLFLGMRMIHGVDLESISRWAGVDPRETHADSLLELEGLGLIATSGDRVFPTELGLRLNDSIALALA